ncbi:MAG TPA: MBL fold metallo-hydrolase, partial [Roseateles sp.]
PVDQSVDQYVAAGHAWNRQVLAAGAQALPAATAQPAAVAERAAEIWSTPQGFIKAAQANNAAVRGNEVSFTIDGKWRYVGWLNAAGQVERIQTWVPTPVLGDTLLETRFEGWRDFNGIPFPSRILRSQGGHPVLDLQVSEVKAGAITGLDVPQNVREAKPAPVTVNIVQLAEGVHYVTGGTHHSVAIEQRDHLVLVEAPQNEERSEALLAKLKAQFPDKPVRTLVNTHAHFDHSGGLRTLVAEGATIVTAESNRAFYESAWAAPRTLEPDQLAKSPKAAKFQTFRGKLVINDGSRAIEIHEIAGNGHNDAFALVYLPQSKVLVQADAYTPLAANAPRPTSLNPYTINLVQNVDRLKLDVAQVAALHGPGVVTVADLRSAAGLATR